MNAVLIGVIGLLLAGMLVIGWAASRNQTTAADFMIGGRRFGLFISTATQIAATFGGGVMLAQVGIGYRWGFAVMVYSSIAAPLGVFLLARYFARWLRSQDFYTTTDWMCQQYGESRLLRGLTSTVVSLYAVAAAVAQPIAAGKILSVTTGLPFELCLILAAVVVIIYTTAGGIIAVAYADVAQMAVMVLLIVGLLPLAIIKAGGLSEIFAAVPPQNLTLFAPGDHVLLGWFLAVLPATMVKQTYHLRIFGAKNEQIAARGLYNLALAGCFIGVWAALMGMSIYAINPGLEDPEHATVWIVQNLLPPWLMILVLGAMVAAIAAAADSALHSFSSSFTRDIYQVLWNPNATDRQLRRVSQISVVAVGLVGIVIAIAVPVVLDALLLGYSLTAAGLFFPLIVGRFWKQATQAGAIAGIVAGVSVTVLFHIVGAFGDHVPAVAGGLAASLIALVVVSKFHPGTKVPVLQRS
ncbi:sodium:solute symporter family protein [Peristeroidobacter agariperforans]|uniref:sodium:solute symporter family protein n=1 Tax=Peristeroidobacter agariperforans TaxID=268404 RepID=UPI00101E11DE|nr:sodium:solute symporter family protein [Peristeroidobacter agariperforans]